MTAPVSTREETVLVSGPRPPFQPALAFAVGLILILAAVGGVVLWAGGGGEEVVDEPATTMAPTTAPPTTQPPSSTTLPVALDGKIETHAYADVPSFTATIQYYEHDPASGQAGWEATVELRHAGPMAFEATVLAESGEFSTLTGADTLFIGDGKDVWVMEGGDLGPIPLPLEPFRHVFFDGEHSTSAWDEICGTTPAELGVVTLVGRTATHIACSSTLEDYELWVDEESGLILRMKGPLGVGDYSPYLARDGLFEFTEIVFEPVATPEAPESHEPSAATADLDLPPLHMIRKDSTELRDSAEFWTEREIWYLDGRTFRKMVIDAAELSRIGSFTFAADGQAGSCYPGEGFCEVDPLEEGQSYRLFDDVPEELVAEHCAAMVDDTVAGRSAHHFSCDGIRFDMTDRWLVMPDVTIGVSDYWYDIETGLLVKAEAEAWGWETTLLEINPQFPAGIFEYETPEWIVEQAGLQPGSPAPSWSGPLVDGGVFDTADYAGMHLVVLNWVPYCSGECLTWLVEYQSLAEQFGSDSIAFVTVSDDTLAETAQALDRLGVTLPAVYCWPEPDPVTHAQPPLCLPESSWEVWGHRVPSVTVIGPDGVTIEVFADPPVGDDLEALLVEISG